MSDIAIRSENLGKQYRIGGKQAGFRTFREALLESFSGPLRWMRGERKSYETFWALDDVSFEIKHGEAVGIIGRNGAGKSTLLKILSRITKPTKGRADLYGRVASLLEVGTGFHSELTGRDNVYLNGAIMGMSRAEVSRKFDEIVDFSGVERFVDTPVKRYSSGMYMRLAFAVAAHLEPEILIVDEVLAVGDAAFQKKCLSKMEDVTHQGRTVLFVSHNIGAINSLCSRCLLLENGKVFKDGSTSEVIDVYQSSFYNAARDLSNLSSVERYGTGKAQFSALEITPVNEHGETQAALITGSDLKIDLTIHARDNVVDAMVCVVIHDSTGFRLIDVSTAMRGYYLSLKSGQSARVEFQLHDLFLKPGAYFLGLWLGHMNIEHIDAIDYVTSITVEPNINDLKHTIDFPGIYQCQFSQQVTIN